MKSLSLAKPHAIIMVGIPGSGKTFFAKQFSDTFGAPRLAIDDILPHAASKDAANQVAHAVLDELLKTKLSIVVELDTATRSNRRELTQKLRKAGYAPLVIWVQVDQPTAQARYKRTATEHKPSFDSQIQRFNPPHAQENPTVISGKHTYATQAKVVLKRLSEPRADASRNSEVPSRSAERHGIVIN